ncbi:MAG: folate-binding protein YgfZ [Anaerolineales bacterium]|nr:folate-binding protein YgfZ [Chloroflexota bacterium]MBL6980310.1 folate-binding protein YgfZ [Anaerolineales bacterium]
MADLSAYHSALEGVIYYQYPIPGYLRIGGEDRLDFLQRQTTNDIRQLDSARAMMSVLTSPAARILGVFTLLNEGDQIGVLTLPGRSDFIADFLRKRIFFNDDVSLEDHSQDYAQVIVEGPRSSDVLSTLGENLPELDEVSQVDVEGVSIRIIGQPGFDGFGYRILLQNASCEKVYSALANAGAIQLDEDTYQVLRVEAGIPGAHGELTEEFTPLEVGLLKSAISQSKGCYTGQEVIARQINFDKITRKLVGLRLNVPVNAGEQARANDKPAGQVTSVATSPRFGEIALAVVKRPFDQPGAEVNVGNVRAVVSEIPFSLE